MCGSYRRDNQFLGDIDLVLVADDPDLIAQKIK